MPFPSSLTRRAPSCATATPTGRVQTEEFQSSLWPWPITAHPTAEWIAQQITAALCRALVEGPDPGGLRCAAEICPEPTSEVITTDALDFLGDAANYAMSHPGSSNPRLTRPWVLHQHNTQHLLLGARRILIVSSISIHRMNQHFLRDCCHGEDSA